MNLNQMICFTGGYGGYGYPSYGKFNSIFRNRLIYHVNLYLNWLICLFSGGYHHRPHYGGYGGYGGGYGHGYGGHHHHHHGGFGGGLLGGIFG